MPRLLNRRRFPSVTPQEYLEQEEELIRDPTPRLPLVLCLDCSFEMRHRSLPLLSAGLRGMVAELARHPIASRSLELCLVTCGGQYPQVELEFRRPGSFEFPELVGSTGCPLADGIHMALRSLDRRMIRYEQTGVPYFSPWFLVLARGDSCGTELMRNAAWELARWRSKRSMRLEVHAIGPETGLNLEPLGMLRPDTRILRVTDEQILPFCRWLIFSTMEICHGHVWETFSLPDHPEWGEPCNVPDIPPDPEASLQAVPDGEEDQAYEETPYMDDGEGIWHSDAPEATDLKEEDSIGDMSPSEPNPDGEIPADLKEGEKAEEEDPDEDGWGWIWAEEPEEEESSPEEEPGEDKGSPAETPGVGGSSSAEKRPDGQGPDWDPWDDPDLPRDFRGTTQPEGDPWTDKALDGDPDDGF